MPTRPTNPTPKNLRAVAAAGLRTMAATCKNSCREPARIIDANQSSPCSASGAPRSGWHQTRYSSTASHTKRRSPSQRGPWRVRRGSRFETERTRLGIEDPQRAPAMPPGVLSGALALREHLQLAPLVVNGDESPHREARARVCRPRRGPIRRRLRRPSRWSPRLHAEERGRVRVARRRARRGGRQGQGALRHAIGVRARQSGWLRYARATVQEGRRPEHSRGKRGDLSPMHLHRIQGTTLFRAPEAERPARADRHGRHPGRSGSLGAAAVRSRRRRLQRLS